MHQWSYTHYSQVQRVVQSEEKGEELKSGVSKAAQNFPDRISLATTWLVWFRPCSLLTSGSAAIHQSDTRGQHSCTQNHAHPDVGGRERTISHCMNIYCTQNHAHPDVDSGERIISHCMTIYTLLFLKLCLTFISNHVALVWVCAYVNVWCLNRGMHMHVDPRD